MDSTNSDSGGNNEFMSESNKECENIISYFLLTLINETNNLKFDAIIITLNYSGVCCDCRSGSTPQRRWFRVRVYRTDDGSGLGCTAEGVWVGLGMSEQQLGLGLVIIVRTPQRRWFRVRDSILLPKPTVGGGSRGEGGRSPLPLG